MSRKLLTGIEHLGGNRYEAMLNFFSPGPVEFRHQGDLDPEGRFSGYTVLRVSPREYCYRGRCSWPAFMRVAGHFVDGELQGPVTLVSRGERSATFYLFIYLNTHMCTYKYILSNTTYEYLMQMHYNSNKIDMNKKPILLNWCASVSS